MSKWKDLAVNIKQILDIHNSFVGIIALGEDNRLYEWDRNKGAWLKYWNEQDKPKEPL